MFVPFVREFLVAIEGSTQPPQPQPRSAQPHPTCQARHGQPQQSASLANTTHIGSLPSIHGDKYVDSGFMAAAPARNDRRIVLHLVSIPLYLWAEPELTRAGL